MTNDEREKLGRLSTSDIDLIDYDSPEHEEWKRRLDAFNFGAPGTYPMLSENQVYVVWRDLRLNTGPDELPTREQVWVDDAWDSATDAFARALLNIKPGEPLPWESALPITEENTDG